MFKKIISIVLVAVMVFGAAPLAGFIGLELPEFNLFTTKAEATTDGYYTYSVSNGEAAITDVDTSISGDIVIPSTLGGYPVTSIGSGSFQNCSILESVTIPDSVTSIGALAFSNCTSLTSVIISDSVTSIGYGALYNCSILESVTIPDSVTSIGEMAFAECTSLESVTIPDGVTSIEYMAFFKCTSLESVTIPDSVTSIGNYAFQYCTSLESVIIPASVTIISIRAFSGCTNLESVTIPESVTSIGDYAFYNCDGLTSVIIPKRVTSLGEAAFFDCSGITSITVDPANQAYSSDKDGVLYNKSKTELIQYPAGNGIKSYTVLDGVTNIGMGAFRACKNLTSATIPDSVTKIGEFAFSFSRKLASVTIPETVTRIELGAFYECTALKDVYYGGSKAEWEEIEIGGSNDPIFYHAKIHYNSTESDGGSTDVPDYDSSVVDASTVKTPTETTISYGDSIVLHVDPAKIPEGGKVEWYASNGNFSYSVSADGTTCTISPSKSGDTIFTAIVYDAEGNIVSADTQTMTSKAGFFDKLIAFFKKLFGLTKTIPEAIKSIY